MSAVKKYNSAPGMRMALEERLKNLARSNNLQIMRLRHQVSFDRFLARIYSKGVKDLVVKGGYALELRLRQAAI